jgi:hypothetical protein
MQYKHLFSRTYKFLPPIDNHPIPDAQHVTLATLSLITLIIVTVAFLTERKAAMATRQRQAADAAGVGVASE